MLLRTLLLSFLFTFLAVGQTLPDRDELVKQFLVESTSTHAAQELIKHFQMGGLRTILRNINNLPTEKRVQYGQVFRYMDLMRFRNDLNTNLEKAENVETRATFLMLLATIGRSLEKATFEKYINDETLDMRIRLAAASGIIKVQNPAIYDRFHELANDAVVDPTTGQNDLQFADISKTNLGFFLYSKGKVYDKTATHGQIVTALAMVEADATDVYKDMLDNKRKKYVPLMIDRAIQVGGVQLLELMKSHKTCKKFKAQISYAMAPARAIASHRAKFIDNCDIKTTPTGPLVPFTGSGVGRDGYRSAYAVVHISETGELSVLSHDKPYGGTDNLKDLLSGVTLPAYKDWKPTESYVLVVAP